MNLPTAACTTCLGVGFLVACRAFRSSISCPVGTCFDSHVNACIIYTWWWRTNVRAAWQNKCTSLGLLLFFFRQPADHSLPERVLDVLVTMLIELFIILSWHGLWTIIDVLSEGHGYLEIELDRQAWFSFVSRGRHLVPNCSAASLKKILHTVYRLLGRKCRPGHTVPHPHVFEEVG